MRDLEGNSAQAHEHGLFETFILPQRRERYLEMLSKPSGRKKLLPQLAHFKDIDPERIVKIEPRFQHAKDIFSILREKGAPDDCYCFSEWDEIHGKMLPLDGALKTVVGARMGTFLSCLPGRLAYFEDEDQRCILEWNRLAKNRRRR